MSDRTKQQKLIDVIMAERDRMAEALSWYSEQASAATKYLDDPSKAMALLAVLTALALDGGSRARTALEARVEADAVLLVRGADTQ